MHDPDAVGVDDGGSHLAHDAERKRLRQRLLELPQHVAQQFAAMEFQGVEAQGPRGTALQHPGHVVLGHLLGTEELAVRLGGIDGDLDRDALILVRHVGAKAVDRAIHRIRGAIVDGCLDDIPIHQHAAGSEIARTGHRHLRRRVRRGFRG